MSIGDLFWLFFMFTAVQPMLRLPRALEASKKICRACRRGVRMFLYRELVGRASTCDAKSS